MKALNDKFEERLKKGINVNGSLRDLCYYWYLAGINDYQDIVVERLHDPPEKTS